MTHSFRSHNILNILSGKVYTKMEEIYDFFDTVVPHKNRGYQSTELPNARKAILPLLEGKFPDLPSEGYHPEFPNEVITFEFTEEDTESYWLAFARGSWRNNSDL